MRESGEKEAEGAGARTPSRAKVSGEEKARETKPPKSQRLRALLPDLLALVRPRKGILVAGFFLMAVGRAAGLVLPASTKVLIDDVVGKSRADLLMPLLGAVARQSHPNPSYFGSGWGGTGRSRGPGGGR